MSITLKRLATGTLTGVQAVYPASGVNTQIDACALTNNSASDVTVSIWLASGGAPSQQNIILKDFSIPAGSTKKAYEVAGQVIEDGATLYAQASTDGVVTLVASGREQTVSS